MVGAWVVEERGRLVLTLARDDACAEDCCFRRTAKKRSFIRSTAPKRASALRSSFSSLVSSGTPTVRTSSRGHLPRHHYETLTVTPGGSARDRDRASAGLRIGPGQVDADDDKPQL